MQQIVIFGKGGVGKSTVAANLSVVYAGLGRRVLHVGCDPKHDATALLVDRSRINTVLAPTADGFAARSIEEMVVTSHLGIDCLEAGGPEPGVGCGGRGVSLVLQMLHKEQLVRRAGYDTVVFDVLGDIVCGGFAAPLRTGFGEKTVLVVSEELMSLYAANNIARAVRTYADNGTVLVGMVANCKDPHVDTGMLERFARLLNTRILVYVPRDPEVRAAEYEGRTLLEAAPESATADVLRDLAATILAIEPGDLELPTPLSDDDFYDLSRVAFRGGPTAGSAPEPKPAPRVAPSRPSELRVVEDGVGAGPSLGVITGPAGEPSSRGENVFEPADSIMRSWGNERRWWQFFCDEELSLHVAKPTLRNAVYVIHETLECHYANCRSDDGSVAFFKYPWPRNTVPALSTTAALRALGSEMLVTDIGDQEIVLGGMPKLGSILDGIANDPGDIELIIVLTSCVPVVTGDDHVGVVERFRRRCSVPIVFMDVSWDQHRDLLIELFERVQATPKYWAVEPEEGRINLIGYPDDASFAELRALLGDLGLEVNSCILPEFDLASIRRFPRARLQVRRPHSAYERLYRSFFDTLPASSIEPAAPYGVRGTREWLGAIAEAMGVDAAWEERLAWRWQALQPRWDVVSRQAREHRLAFVVDQQRVLQLNDSKWTSGIPLIRTILEIGFGVDLLAYCGRCGSAAEGRHRKTAPPGETAVHYFHSPEELSELLATGPFAAVYSDLAFDHRLSRAGVAQFSSTDFVTGLAGAVRTAENLLGVCQLPFYKKYARYLTQRDPVNVSP